jgi:hypothetical protein
MRTAKGRQKTRKTRKAKPLEIAPSYQLEPLDPWLMCGPDTTVTELWKVRERREKETLFHMVYFDRYGWYCEHGRACKAVAEVRQVVRTMSANAPRPKSPGKKARARKRK